MKFHHLGIACEDIQASIEKMKEIFEIAAISEVVFDPLQNVNLCLVRTIDGQLIEFIEGEKILSFVKKKQQLYHVCYETDEMECSIKKLLEQGGVMMSALKPALLFNHKRVAFVYCFLGIVELLEK